MLKAGERGEKTEWIPQGFCVRCDYRKNANSSLQNVNYIYYIVILFFSLFIFSICLVFFFFFPWSLEFNLTFMSENRPFKDYPPTPIVKCGDCFCVFLCWLPAQVSASLSYKQGFSMAVLHIHRRKMEVSQLFIFSGLLGR